METLRKCKLQNLLLILLSVALEDVKVKVYEIEQAIIDKSVYGLKAQLFEYVEEDVIDKIAEGL